MSMTTLNVARDRNSDTSPELRLWQSIVVAALTDTQLTAKNIEARRAKHNADEWLSGNSRDFREVCSAAGLDPDFIRENYINGTIDFERLKRATPGAAV